jgi:hypothetical protein
VFYYDTLDDGRTVSWFLRLSLHAGRMFAKVTAQKINLTLSSSYPKIVCLPRISGSGPSGACIGCLLYILPTRAWRVHVMRVHGDGGVYTRRIKRGHRA